MAIIDLETSLPSFAFTINYNEYAHLMPLDQPLTPRHDVPLVCSIDATPPPSPPPPPPFEITPIKGKGLGVVATQSLSRGDVVLVEAPVIRMKRSDSSGMASKQFRHLSDEKKEQVLALANIRDPEELKPLRGIMWTNAIGLRGTDEEIGLFITASRINHACRPNTNNSWDPDTGTMTLIATREIKVGEEITSTYIEGFAISACRRTHLGRLLRFTCCCDLCELDEGNRIASDYRIMEINAVKEKRNRELKWGSHVLKLQDIDFLVKYYGDDGVADWNVAEAYALGYMVAQRQGDFQKVWCFAEFTASEYATVDGEGSIKAREWRDKAAEAKRESIEAGKEKLPEMDGKEFKKWLFQDKAVTGCCWDLIQEHRNAAW